MEKSGKGFSYEVSIEQIREWRNVPAVEKLRWLEEVNNLVNKISDRKTKELREKFRRGEL